MKQIKKSRHPVVLTMNGKVAAVHGAKANQRLLDVDANADTGEGIRQGMEGAKQGRVRPVEEFFEEFEAKYGLRLGDDYAWLDHRRF